MERFQYEPEELLFIEHCVMPFAVFQTINQRIVTIALSAGFCELYGFDNHMDAYAVFDSDVYYGIHPEDVDRVTDAVQAFARGEAPYDIIYRIKIKDEYRIIHVVGKHTFPEPDVKLAMVWHTDEGIWNGDETINWSSFTSYGITDKVEEEHFREKHYDPLTGLPNMNYFFVLSEVGRDKMIAEGLDPAILYIDMNGMRFFNKRFGFKEGDRLLNLFARLLIETFGEENCCRFSQDHFTVFTDSEGLDERLHQLIEDTKRLNRGRNVPITIGVYRNSTEAVRANIACDRAKQACNAKRIDHMSTFHYFNISMLAQEMNHQYITENLDRAIEEGWIQAYYHPIVRSANGRVCDEEALARWIDPEQGVLSPADFIPVLEESKQAYKVDLCILEHVLKKMQIQAEEGLYVVPISINLSRTDFDCCDIVDEICKRVDAAGIGREKLTIEITESVIGNDFVFMKKQIARFQREGFKVWMDDFGSGYSSLDLLQEIPFNLIKLDMRFMSKFGHGDKSQIILTELIRMAISLGIETVAEGVETKEQVEFLREVGCSKMQGFYFCRPIPLERILERYKQGIQIGFENPEESAYFASVGNVNLYDLSVVSRDGEEIFRHYFNTLPMGIIEADKEGFQLTRCNRAYRGCREHYLELPRVEEKIAYDFLPTGLVATIAFSLQRCIKEDNRVFVTETVDSGETVHICIRKVATNPVSGMDACVMVILGFSSGD